MSHRTTLLAMVAAAQDAGRRVAESLPESELAATGTWDTWAPKEALGHVIHWIEHDLDRLLDADSPIQSIEASQIDDLNQTVHRQYQAMSWPEVAQRFQSVLDRCGAAVAELTDEQIDLERSYSDGTTFFVWRNLGFHLANHLASHISMVLRRGGHGDLAVRTEEEICQIALGLDDDPAWQGSTKYNLACSYAREGDADRAVPLLSEALGLRPSLIDWARKDEDLDPIRKTPGFSEIYE